VAGPQQPLDELPVDLRLLAPRAQPDVDQGFDLVLGVDPLGALALDGLPDLLHDPHDVDGGAVAQAPAILDVRVKNAPRRPSRGNSAYNPLSANGLSGQSWHDPCYIFQHEAYC